MGRPPEKVLVSIQYLRALAALLVVIFHAGGQFPAYGQFIGYPRFAVGVDIFFVISGFVMIRTGAALAPAEFITRRVIRIAPLYWILTTVLVVLALLAPRYFSAVKPSASYYFLSLFFIPFHNQFRAGEMLPVLAPGWTLNYEMFFYAVFALCLWFRPARLVSSTGVMLGLLVAVGTFVPGFYTSPLLAEFWLGILIGAVYERIRLPRGGYAALIVGGFVWLLGFDSVLLPASRDLANTSLLGHGIADSLLLQELAAGAIVLGAVCWEREKRVPFWGLGLALGDASYSLYLTHPVILGFLRTAWAIITGGARGGWLEAVAFAVASTVVVVSAGLLSYRYLEVPITRRLQSAARRMGLSRSNAVRAVQAREGDSSVPPQQECVKASS